MALRGKVERIDGKLIGLPIEMEYKDAIKTLKALDEEWNSAVSIDEKIQGPLLDSIIAFSTAFRDTIGVVDGDTQIKRIEGPGGVAIEALWGRFDLTGLSGYLGTKVRMHRGKPILAIVGEVLRKHEDQAMAILTKTREILATQSIYKGQALRMNVEPFNPDSDDPFLYAPTFMDVPRITLNEVVLNPEVLSQVNASIINPIVYRDAAKRVGVPFKRGVLLEGSFGVGKTLISTLVSRIAVDNGITFIHLPNAENLAETIEFASQYQPAVIFCEDIDRVTKGERNEELDEILNTVDGAESKNRDIMLVFTTNAMSSINKAMLRKGRLDAVIHISAPDAMSVERLIKLYGRDAIAPDADLAPAATLLVGSIPADIREVVERAKLSALPRFAQWNSQHGDTPMILFGFDILEAAKGFVAERAFLDTREERKPTLIERTAEVFAKNVATAMLTLSRASGTTLELSRVDALYGTRDGRGKTHIYPTTEDFNAIEGDHTTDAQGEN